MDKNRCKVLHTKTLLHPIMSHRHYEGLAGLSKTLIAMIFVLVSIQSYSQCSLKCNNQVNISLDENCMATVTPEMIINSLSTTCPGGMYSVRLESTNGAIIDPPIVGLSQVDQTFSARVTDSNSGNNCWGNVTIEYKLAPAIQCPENDTVSCAAVDVLGVPTATARCGGGSFEVFLLDEQRETLECDTVFTGIVTRTYRAVDNATGNFSDCMQTLHLERIDFSGIVFPDNATIACDDPNFIFNDNGFPIPFISGEIPTGSGSAGVPIICMPSTGSGTMGTPNNIGFAFAACGSGSTGVPILPIDGASIATDDGPVIVPSNIGSFCGAALVFTDIPVSSNPCRKTIMRTFEVIEWFCGADSSRVGAQIIEVIDTTAPVFICPQDFTVSSDEDCEMLVDFPSVNATDGCSNGIIVQIDPEGSPIVNSNGGQGMLQSGVNLVTYTVRDSCYNSATCQLSVTVQDQVEPVAICESRTTVALTSSGSTFVNASTFDDGSWDGCGVDRFEVRRMTTDCNPDDLVFGQQVEFCCTDAGAEVMVVFRVYDTSGNTNDCMVSVEVQDKVAPSLECPLNINVDCRVAFDANDLATTFGEAKVIGNCSTSSMVSEEVDMDVNQCNIGMITRTFSISDNDISTIDPQCVQVITITNTAPFTESMIQWPSDFVSTSGVCTIDDVNPEDLDPQFAFPIFTGGDDQCSMLGFSHEDNLVSSNVPGQCFRIERTWFVINWCDDTGNTFTQLTDPDGPQIIEVSNTEGPMTDAFDPITIESQNIDCTSGLIEYTRTGTGSCSGSLDWSYVVNDLGGNQMAVGDTNVFSEILVAAQYNVVWTISDECNNTITQNQPLTVVNTKAPTPVCMTNLTFALDTPTDTNGDGMNDGASLELWASDFDGGSYHTCNNPISVSLSDDPTDTNITFTCDSVGLRTLRLYVTDNVTMAQDYCTFTVMITDGGMCDDMQRVVLEGDIYTEDYQSIEDVEVNLINGNAIDMTNEEGHYAFNDMPMGGNYIVSPEKDINYLNGVSTLDLVYIQRHILNIEPLDSPYKLIAADANDSHSVTALDLIELRKLILGAHDELPNNSSWRFVDVDHNFIDEINPWLVDMPEDYSINNLEEDMVIDFIGIKVGDVNGTVIPNLQSQVLDNRSSRWPLSFTISNKEIKKGSAAVSFYSDSYERVSGWQMTLEFDPNDITISSITSDVLDITSYNYYIGAQDEGWISISYNSDEPVDIDQNLEVFRVEFNSDKSLSEADIFEITSKITPAESYRGLNEVVDVRLKVQNGLGDLDIVSASPNPWKDQTDVSFTISEGGLCHWNIYDVRGQLVYASDHNYTAGKHQLIIDRNHIPNGGVYYLKLITQNGSAEYKLMVID